MEERQWGLTTEQKQVSGFFHNNSVNGIIIFTEDSDNEHEFYVKFYKRLLEDSDVKIDRVIPLGSCDKVQQRCQEDNDTSFPKLYVIDGDIYLQYDNPKQSQDRLCVLDRYCIENYLIDEETLYNVIKIFKKEFKNKETTIEEIKTKLKYTFILKNFAQCFIPIYHYCSILSEENKKIKQSKSACFSVQAWDHYYDISSNSCITESVENFVSETKSELKALGIVDSYINDKLYSRQAKFPYNIPTLIKIVSAKKHIFPFLMALTTREFGVSPSLSDWKIKSADFYDTTPLDFLKEKIVNVYNEWKKAQINM